MVEVITIGHLLKRVLEKVSEALDERSQGLSLGNWEPYGEVDSSHAVKKYVESE
jgi:hypothetical protein